MTNYVTASAAAVKLAELSREVDELERSRSAMLTRVNAIRRNLQKGGQRTARIRASVDLLCEHMSNMIAALDELRVLEEEAREIGREVVSDEKETGAIAFEAQSFRDTLDEADIELERLSEIVMDGKGRRARGH